MATQIAERRAHPVDVFRQMMEQRAAQLKMALPSHISVEKFQRVAIVAVQTNPDLLDPRKVDRASLFVAFNKAANDGLLPDGHEGAIVPYKGKAQWQPMKAGIMKKVRQSGEVSNWSAHAVFANDEFDYLLGDDERIYHKPTMEEPGEVVGAYSIVTFKDGTKSRDFLPRWRIEKARAQGTAKDSLMWTRFYDEGAVKTVIRHHGKTLPMSTDVEAAFARDETMQHVEDSAAALMAHEPAPISRLDALESHLDQDSDQPPAVGLPSDDAEPTPQADDAGASATEGQDTVTQDNPAATEGRDDSEMGEEHTDDEHPARRIADDIIHIAGITPTIVDLVNVRSGRANDIAAMPDEMAREVTKALDAAELRLRRK